MNDSGEFNTIIQYPRDEVVGTKFIDEISSTQTSNLNQKNEKNALMTSSVASALDDSTPSDSGVQLMDSISSDMNESLMSNLGLDYDSIPSSAHKPDLSDVDEVSGSVSLIPDEIMAGVTELVNKNSNNCLDVDEIAMTKSDIDNSNVDSDFLLNNGTGNEISDEMKTSTCSTFDTDAIVFRRKVRKPRTSSTSSSGGSVKKRVSFHEDILKNTKTDNIHIERGFVTYKGCSKKAPYRFLRNSWCSQGQCHDYGDDVNHACYRNACSDVLDYGQMDVFDDTEPGTVQFDNSGVFEYVPRETNVSPPLQKHQPKMLKAASNDDRGFYNCKCSESNSSLESNDNTNGNDCKRTDYSKTKSNSCDCIGQVESNKLNNNGSPNMTDNCYFSEPCIGTINDYDLEPSQPKSVWRKELKPKSSCLKKTVRETSVILEHDVNSKVKKFNVHQLPDVNHLFGSIKNIFSTIPERGVPEGCEDLHNVYECVPDTDSPMKSLPVQEEAQSKSSPNQEQIETPPGSSSKRKPVLSLFPFPTADEMMHVSIADDTMDMEAEAVLPGPSNAFRNKFIVNCESTVFEHTGVFENTVPNIPEFPSPNSNCVTPQKTSKSILSFSSAKQKLGNIFSSFRSSNSSTKSSSANISPKSASTQCLYRERDRQSQQEQLQEQLKKLHEEQMVRSWNSSYDYYRHTAGAKNPFDCTSSLTSSIISNSSDKNSEMSASTVSSSTNTSNQENSCDRFSVPKFFEMSPPAMSPTSVVSSPTPASNTSSPKSKTKHLASPMRRKSSASNFDRTNLSPDLFCAQKSINHNPMILLSEEFDDLLTITTTSNSPPVSVLTSPTSSTSTAPMPSTSAAAIASTSGMNVPHVEMENESSENDMEIVDYSTAVKEAEMIAAQLKYADRRNQYLRPPSSKSSLINRFLRNVTQKKINDITVKKNIIMSNKYKQQPKAFSSLYVKPNKPIEVIKKAIMDSFTAEIAQEIEAHHAQIALSKTSLDEDDVEEAAAAESIKVEEEFGVGVGEISVDLFDISQLHILRDEREKLIKVFKLYTGYNLLGHMTPVLVFLTNKTLYVTDLVRNRLCNKFVLPYTELDVILVGPHGNTVLLSNSARDMQQVLLAGGPYPADGLVSSLEFCARRCGAELPAIGNLTFDHLGPLQNFVNQHCAASKNDAWIYYAVVSVPANVLSHEDEPLGPHVKGPLMHRSLSLFGDQQNQPWLAGYFLLKAGVLYMFADSNKKLPSMVIALSECKGARRACHAPRPHCFEILLQTGVLQLAAPDEYVASEWLISVVQSASGLYENQERHKTLGCTLVVTSNHLITLREDFTSPLRRLNSKGAMSPAITRPFKDNATMDRKMSLSTVSDMTFNDVSSTLSTPSRLTTSSRSSPSHWQLPVLSPPCEEKSFSSISSIYGKNSGVEVKTCAPLKEMVSVRIPSQNDQWWCIVEFSCQEVRESSDDMVIFFATFSDMRRFLSILESVWQTKNARPFPLSCLPDNDFITNHGSSLFRSLNRSWEPLISAALGFPQ